MSRRSRALKAQAEAVAIARAAERSRQRTLMEQRHAHHSHLKRLDLRAQYGIDGYGTGSYEDIGLFISACDAFIAQWGEDKLSDMLRHSLAYYVRELSGPACSACGDSGMVRTSPDDADTCMACDAKPSKIQALEVA